MNPMKITNLICLCIAASIAAACLGCGSDTSAEVTEQGAAIPPGADAKGSTEGVKAQVPEL